MFIVLLCILLKGVLLNVFSCVFFDCSSTDRRLLKLVSKNKVICIERNVEFNIEIVTGCLIAVGFQSNLRYLFNLQRISHFNTRLISGLVVFKFLSHEP